MAKKPATEVVTEESNSPETPTERPCATVRRIASEMRAADPATTRKQIIDACVAAGCNLHTSKTQYQKWHKSQ